MKAGEQVIIPAAVLHWHGATKDEFMVHIALNNPNFIEEESTTFWFDEVKL